tara:strand:+ start:464 stop:619 length:156 start_codon:yes stop_codon:yes gene_type:complete
MTKRQRVIAQEEAPISTPISSEPIRMAEARIKELKGWIKLRKQDELKKRQG